MLFNRYGIYMTPEAGNFARLGASWLGWNLEKGHSAPHPPELNDTLLNATQIPRKYGFHGTIKPPFHLAEGSSYEQLLSESLQLCAKYPPVNVEAFEVKQIGSFLALVAKGDLQPLASLAANVLQNLDSFRAPPSSEELTRRRKANLTPLQETNLKNWGYPFVLDAFKFHLTLSGPMPNDTIENLAELARQHFAPVLKQPIRVTSLTLVGEAGDGRFHALHRLPLLDQN